MPRNADTLKLLHETEKKLKQQTEQAYVNMDLSTQEREKGNKVRQRHTRCQVDCAAQQSAVRCKSLRHMPRANAEA